MFYLAQVIWFRYGLRYGQPCRAYGAAVALSCWKCDSIRDAAADRYGVLLK